MLDIEYLKGQAYLDAHPKELMLRNHVRPPDSSPKAEW
jgi:hypothetical protein